jgi:hypothetical protein
MHLLRFLPFGREPRGWEGWLRGARNNARILYYSALYTAITAVAGQSVTPSTRAIRNTMFD